jgi:hypothetical protein
MSDKLRGIARDLCLRTVAEDDATAIARAWGDQGLTKAEINEVARIISNTGAKLSYAGGALIGANTFARDDDDEQPAAELPNDIGWLQ